MHIKVHVPEKISHGVHETAVICEPAHKITHHRHHHQHRKYPQKSVRTQIRHNQYDGLLENILLADFKTPVDNTHIEYTKHADDMNEYLNHHTEGYNSANGKTILKRPLKYVKTNKVIEYKEPTNSKNVYSPPHQHKHQHKPKTHNEIFKIVESKYLLPTVDGHELRNTAEDTDHHHYPDRTQVKPTKSDANSQVATYLATANDYRGYKSHRNVELHYNDADPSTREDFKLNMNIYLPPYETAVLSADHADAGAYDFLTSKETLTLPTKEAENFHGQLQYPTFDNKHFKPFIGDMYLPVKEESLITQEATETYTGIDSYSARHVQGLDHLNYSPYRRWSSFI